MNDWQLYLKIYFAIGLVVSLSVMISHRWTRRGETSFARDLLDVMEPRRASFWYRLMEDRVIPVLTVFIMWIVWPVVFVLKLKDLYEEKSRANKQEKYELENVFTLSLDALIKQVSIVEVEDANFIIDPLEAVPPIPFGHLNERWVDLRDGMQEGETLWEFESADASGDASKRISGYAVRNEVKVDRWMVVGRQRRSSLQ